MAVRRVSWINARAELLAALLNDRYGFALSKSDARAEVSDRIDHVASLLRVDRAAAKFYVTAEAIDELADLIGREVLRKRAQQTHLAAARHLTLAPNRHTR